MQSLVTVSIVIYRQDIGELAQCLSSLDESLSWAIKLGLMQRAAVYIVQNDHIAIEKELRRKLPYGFATALHFISGHGNIGFGCGHNLVLERLTSDYHLIMNADVMVGGTTISDCLQWLGSDLSTVMAVATGFDCEDHCLYLAKRYPDLLSLFLRALGFDKRWVLAARLTRRYTYQNELPSPRPFAVELASGCFMLARASALKEVGGFDPRFFLYFEDFDLSIRIAELGKIVQLPTPIIHFGGMAAKKGFWSIRLFVKSAFLFFRKHGWRLV